jgi:type II secretory pathway pseudopilin PulG
MADRAPDAGFALLELIVCVGVLLFGSVFALALVPALARASQTQLMREAADGVARNAIERVRAAGAYDPPAALADPATRAATASTHAWLLQPTATYAAAVRVRRALCGGAGPTTDVPVNVTLTYDASADAVTVAVSYPPNPCVPALLETITRTAELAPAAAAPQTRISTAIADPAQQ